MTGPVSRLAAVAPTSPPLFSLCQEPVHLELGTTSKGRGPRGRVQAEAPVRPSTAGGSQGREIAVDAGHPSSWPRLFRPRVPGTPPTLSPPAACGAPLRVGRVCWRRRSRARPPPHRGGGGAAAPPVCGVDRTGAHAAPGSSVAIKWGGVSEGGHPTSLFLRVSGCLGRTGVWRGGGGGL